MLSLGLLAGGCAAPNQSVPESRGEPTDVVADSQAVIDAHRTLVQAYESGDADAFTDMLVATPQLLIFHPLMENRFDGIEEVRENLGSMFTRLGQASWLDAHPVVIVKGDVAWLTTQLVIESPNLEAPFVGRGTELWLRQGDGWRLVHGHWSRIPEEAQAAL
jgi:ketosteroid isomerase-like protein